MEIPSDIKRDRVWYSLELELFAEILCVPGADLKHSTEGERVTIRLTDGIGEAEILSKSPNE